jgi:hypothetical protein
MSQSIQTSLEKVRYIKPLVLSLRAIIDNIRIYYVEHLQGVADKHIYSLRCTTMINLYHSARQRPALLLLLHK